MCGILGVSLKIGNSLEKDSDFQLDAKNRLETALKALSHRGPDGYGSKIFFKDGGCGIPSKTAKHNPFACPFP